MQKRGIYRWVVICFTIMVFEFVVSGCQDKKSIQAIVLPPVVLAVDHAKSRALEIRARVSAQVDSGLVLSLWASDSLLSDPVALDIDDLGRAFVTRTNRRRTSEFDIRSHKDWELASIAFKNVEDRRSFLRKTLTPENGAKLGKPADLNKDGVQDWHDLLVESEEVYRIEDKNGDGIADFSQRVATGFQEEVTDIAGAVLATSDDLFVGVAPDLWRMKDLNGDGVMDEKESISHGFQVHIGFGGHNLSGLIMGPDGRLYWGIGDIGFHGVDKQGKEWSYPNEGVIVRCNPDGTDFEVFAHGLRNTHEFVFDQYGNIISVDNDGDHPGESERIVYVVNGSDAGWRINWQFGKYNDPRNNSYKVWMEEGMFKPRFPGQAAHIVPCIRNYINGPTGMVFNPGTALGRDWLDYFFVVEFNGNPARSGIHAFKLTSEGAGMRFAGDKKILSGILATGLDIGADGALYFTDWIDGWEKKGYGRIWKLDVKNQTLQAERRETQDLLASDFKTKDSVFLSGLLHHLDQRVRQKAQFALVAQGAITVLQHAVEQKDHLLGRMHGIWGLSQLVRKGQMEGAWLTRFLQDEHPEVRAQVCKMLGDIRWKEAGELLLPLLKDPEARVRFFAAEALGRIAYKPAVNSILEMLQTNDDQDVYLRHAGTLALSRIGSVDPIIALADHQDRSMRLAAVVILRHLRHPSIEIFLDDQDEMIVTDVARAINDDLSIEEALSSLGEMLVQTTFSNEALVRRAINANLRVGTTRSMELLLNFATDSRRDKKMRMEALMALSTWIKPSVVDRVDGYYRGAIERDPTEIRAIIGVRLPLLMKDADAEIRIQVAKTLSELGITSSVPMLVKAMGQEQNEDVRAAILTALVPLDVVQAKKSLKETLVKEDEKVRVTALTLLKEVDIDPSEIAESLNIILFYGSSLEKQTALSALANLPKKDVIEQLSLLLDQLIAGRIEGSLQLDLLEVATNNGEEILLQKVKAFRDKYVSQGSVADYLECLEGGSERQGKNVLVNNSAAQCLKCHALQGAGGVAGPPLDDIGTRATNQFILQSLIDPSAHLAPGYGVVTVILQDGQTVSGLLQSEDDRFLIIKDSKEQDIKVSKLEINERINALSSMPAMGEILSKREIRDLLAFLKTLKGNNL